MIQKLKKSSKYNNISIKQRTLDFVLQEKYKIKVVCITLLIYVHNEIIVLVANRNDFFFTYQVPKKNS